MTAPLLGLSSMATRHLLAALADGAVRAAGYDVSFRSGGGVEIAREVREGAAADVVVLAEGALAALAAEGCVVADSVRPLFVSDVVAAVPAGRGAPRLEREEDLHAALLAADRVAYSTGPSGTALLRLIESWGLTDELGGRLVQAPPGVPVGEFVARGEADLGFQQRSELMSVPGIVVLGPLPGAAAIRSVFSGGVLVSSGRPEDAGGVLGVLSSASVANVVHDHGLSPAS